MSAFFQLTTMIISIPSVVVLTAFFISLWGGSIRFNTPMLFALSFLPMFGIGGLTGLPLGVAASDIYLHDTYYVIGHFHYVVAPGTLFALFAGIYYWFPKITGRKLHEGMGKLHFFPSFLAMNGIFMPMFIQGLAGLSRRMYEGLKSFISLDLPFRLGEREERLSFIQKALDNPTVSPAEQLRQVLEGYTVESEYGMKMDTYKDTISIDGQDREVNILRVGRLVLAYQTSDLDQTGVWNKETSTWDELPSRYRNPVKNGIRIAQKLQTVNILEMPIPAAEVVQ